MRSNWTRRKQKTERNRRNRRVEKMEPWRDADKPEAYLSKFERMMKEAVIPKIPG